MTLSTDTWDVPCGYTESYDEANIRFSNIRELN